MYAASGYRTRFITYEILSKVGEAPLQPGAIPGPSGRAPAVAAAAAAAAADAVKEAAAAAAAAEGSGGGVGNGGVGVGAGLGRGGEGGGEIVPTTAAAVGDMQAYGLLAPSVEVGAKEGGWCVVLCGLVSGLVGWCTGYDGHERESLIM